MSYSQKAKCMGRYVPTEVKYELSTDINVITAEINAYQRMAGEAIFEIGRRLKYVKENDLVHGEFGKWLESIRINDRVARMMMTVGLELESKRSTYSEIGLNTHYQIATMPEEARAEPHTIPSTGESKTVDEMTVKEIREVKKQLKEAQDCNKLVVDVLLRIPQDMQVDL